MSRKATPKTEIESQAEPETKQVNKLNSIPFTFIWQSFQPDHRAYKPSNPLMTCSYPVVVDVPLQPDLIYNASKISIAQMTNQTIESPILTPLGVRYIVDQFEYAMSDHAEEPTEDETSDDDWAEIEEDTPPQPKNDDSWDESETDEPAVEKTDEKWDEDWS